MPMLQTVHGQADSAEERAKLEKLYEDIFNQPVFAYCMNVERIIRPYSTEDFVRDYFIPDL